MKKAQINPSLLSEEDLYYLRIERSFNFPVDDDPQSASVYSVDRMEVDHTCPVWSREDVRQCVRLFSDAYGLRTRVCFRAQRDQCAYVGRGGGTIILPADRTHCEYRSVEEGLYVASVVLHELGHVLSHNERPGQSIESHGPEFVRSYLDLLSAVMSTVRVEESLAYLGATIAPCSARDARHADFARSLRTQIQVQP